MEDAVVSLLMKTFFATQLFNMDEQFCVLSEYWGKNYIVCLHLSAWSYLVTAHVLPHVVSAPTEP